MTRIHTIELESVTLFLLAATVGIAMAFFTNHKVKPPVIFDLPVFQNFQTTPHPTPTPIPKVTSSSQVSPDGSRQVTLTTTTNKNGTKTFVFTSSKGNESSKQTLYTVTYASDTMSVPFNTFSPDNFYVFFQHNRKDGTTEALAMRSDGLPIADNVPFENVTQYFVQKATGNTYQTTTGWASDTLLIINTTLSDGSKGPSYWFDIPSKAIIPLATEF